MEKHEAVAWITGGSKGIGFVVAKALLQEGYRVAITSRSEAIFTAQQHLAEQFGDQCIAYQCDSGDQLAVREAHRKIKEAFGTVDLLFNNAGLSPFHSFSETSLEEFDETVRANVLGNFLCAQQVLEDMYAQNQGTIVQMLSIASVKAFKTGAAYGASKFAALGFTNSLREEARKHNVRVISVLAGATETELWDEGMRREFHERMMQPEDIADVILSAIRLPARALMEEVVLRPIGGDL